MRYALLIYGNTEALDRITEEERRMVNAGFADAVARPDVSGHLRLQGVELATTVRGEQDGTLTTDGPFVDSKDFLGGFIFVEADDLDGALAVANDLTGQGLARAVEIRPVNEEELVRG
jgi:hypothetical protein